MIIERERTKTVITVDRFIGRQLCEKIAVAYVQALYDDYYIAVISKSIVAESDREQIVYDLVTRQDVCDGTTHIILLRKNY